MTRSENTENASLQQFTNNPPIDGQNKTTDGDTISVSREEGTTGGIPISIDEIEDPHLQDVVREFTTEELEALVETMLDEDDILDAIVEATDDESLEHNIGVITEHYAEQPSLVEAAADAIEETLGIRPFDLSITEPDNEYLTPMISLTVDQDVLLTKNPDLNTELLEYATRMVGVTKNGQENVFQDWQNAVGGDRVVSFKEDRDPDALGFAIPGQIPATGDRPNRTPITEIPYIGEATAKDLHPSDELMSVEDLPSLTKKQFAWIDFPVNNRDYDDRRARGIASGFVDLMPSNATELLGKTLDMIDRRDSDGALAWVNPANTFGIAPDATLYNESDVTPISEVKITDESVVVEVEDGREAKYSEEYWKMLDTISDVTNSEIEAGEDEPAFLELPDSGFLVVAPITGSDD